MWIFLLQGVAAVPNTQSRVHIPCAVVVEPCLLVQLLAVEAVNCLEIGGIALFLQEYFAVWQVLYLLRDASTVVGDEFMWKCFGFS